MKYYVDSENGCDEWKGISADAAFKSLERVNKIVLYPGDEVLFRRGQKFKGTLKPVGDGSEEDKIRVDSYGEGDAPEIDGNGNYAAVWLKGCSHYVIHGLKIKNGCENRKVRQGICIEGSPLGITEDITVEDCEITQVDGENRRNRKTYESMYWNGAIYVTMPGRSSVENHLHRIHILNNYIHDVRTSGIRINQEEDFIVDIHHTAVVVRGNRIERTGSDGIIVANCISPLISGNVCFEAGALGNKEETMLIAGIWVCAVKDALIERNEVAGTRLFTGDGTAFDTDWGTAGTIVFQYNYTHDNEGGFWLDCSNLNYNSEYKKTVLRYNISVNDREGILVEDGKLPVEIFGNVFINHDPVSVCLRGNGTRAVFCKNEFLLDEAPADLWADAKYQQNYYPHAVCHKDEQGKYYSFFDHADLYEMENDGRAFWNEHWKRLCEMLYTISDDGKQHKKQFEFKNV